MKTFLYRVLCGFFLGLSIFAPGFSGSVMAIIMGIYEEFVHIMSNPFKRFKYNVMFCLPLIIGALFSAALFVIAFDYLLRTYEKALYFLFAGLIAGNLPLIFNKVKDCGFKKHYLIGGIGAFGIILPLCVFAMSAQGIESEAANIGLIMMALNGFAAGIFALVPGMSISTILIITGVYAPLIFMAKSFLEADFGYTLHLSVFAVCAVLGVVFISKGIKAVFEKYPGFASAAMLGFVAGSMIGIMIQGIRLESNNFNWIAGGVMLALGFGVSVLFAALGKIMKQKPE